LASGKHFSGNENYSSCQYPPSPARRPAKLELLVTYIGLYRFPFLAFHEHMPICRASSFLLVPGKRRQGSSETLGLEIASKTNPSKTCFLAGGVVCATLLARTNSEGSMNPAILLVDVASTNREGLRHFLQCQKCDVEEAADGESAVRCCLQMQPDLVLLHDTLPDVGSFELCRQIKKDPLNQLLPVIVVKPSPDQWDIHRGRKAGAMDIWATPPSLWDALGRIQAILRLKMYMDEQARSAVFSLARSVDSKHNLRNGHSERLVAYAEQLGESLGFGEEDLQELRIASWIHDIGKINIPESILLKPGPLDAEERRIMQEHPAIGEKICAPLKSLRRILPVIRHHHEKMDGSGYPDGLRGEAIPLKARILQVADIYDALTTDRPYRGALPPEEALQTLFSEAENGWLDASVVLKFSRLCRDGEFFPVRGRTMLASYYA
jgi:cyclic di-GMP phosphodiesterase